MKKTIIGYGMTGSFCTFEKNLFQMEELIRRGYEVLPVLSNQARKTDTRFMRASELREKLLKITGNEPIDTIVDAEPIGPKKMTDLFLISPASGNTMAKFVNGIYDTPVLLAAKSHLRNELPLVIAVSTNDGLSMAAQNIGRLLNWKNVYFVPFGQDDPIKKPRSLVADFTLIPKTIAAALCGVQLQPILCQEKNG